jgi:hypothetical protein
MDIDNPAAPGRSDPRVHVSQRGAVQYWLG